MKWGNKKEIETWKAIIQDMNEHELKLLFMQILNGMDIGFAIDHAKHIYTELSKPT